MQPALLFAFPRVHARGLRLLVSCWDIDFEVLRFSRFESGVIDCVPLVFFVVTTISTGSRLWAAIASGCEPCAIVAHGDAVGNVTNSIVPLQWACNLSRSTTGITLLAPCRGIWRLPVAAPASTVGYYCLGLQA